MFDLEEIKKQTGVACLDFYSQLPSTNDRAKELIKQRFAQRDFAEFPTLILTSRQTAGRGQRHRKWWSGVGSLTFSWVNFVPASALSPATASATAAGVSLALAPILTGVAVAEAIELQSGLESIEIKWPNDLIVGGKKIAGILVENISASFGSACVVGVGINVNQSDDAEFKIKSLDEPTLGRVELGPVMPTSIQMSMERATSLTELLIAVVLRIQSGFRTLRSDPESIIQQVNGRLAYRGELVHVTRVNLPALIGRCRGISKEGGLVIESATGAETIFSGSIRLASKR